MIPLIQFDCPRTCRTFEAKDFCRFNALLSAIGPTKAHSHTATIKVEFLDRDTLANAVRAMGGVWYGLGTFDLFDSKQSGHGFRLPMANGWSDRLDVRERAREGEPSYWMHPCVIRHDGHLAYDAYGGAWGDLAGLDRLKMEYAWSAARQQALNLGWLCEVKDEGLVVYHPQGGTLTISAKGEIATAGFQGAGCHAAREALGLQVEDGSVVQTAEACAVPATIQQSV